MNIVKIHGTSFSIHLMFFPIMISLLIMGYGKEMLILLAIILIHELSHGLMAMLLGIKIREIKILPFGGEVKLDKTLGFTFGEEILISLAGPLSNIVLSVSVFFLKEYLYWDGEGLDFIIFTSLVIGLFNLLPALPLDGGRIIRSLLSFIFSYKRATSIIVFLSKVIGIFLISLNIYILTLGSYNFTLILIGILIFFQSGKENEIALYSTMKDIAIKKESLNKAGSMEAKHITALPQTTFGEVFKQFTSKKFHIIYVLDKGYKLKDILTEEEILKGIISYGMEEEIKRILEKNNKY